jgi:chromosome segregation ATPase
VKRVNELLKRVADQAADNENLQREKTAAKKSARDLHSRLTQTTQSLNTLTDSYAKRLAEKNELVHENVSIEQKNTMLRGELSGHLRRICELDTKVQQMEAGAGEAKTEKEELKKRIRELEEENGRLGRETEGRGTLEEAVQDLWNRSQSLTSRSFARHPVRPDGFLAKRRREREERSGVYGKGNTYERTSKAPTTATSSLTRSSRAERRCARRVYKESICRKTSTSEVDI